MQIFSTCMGLFDTNHGRKDEMRNGDGGHLLKDDRLVVE